MAVACEFEGVARGIYLHKVGQPLIPGDCTLEFLGAYFRVTCAFVSRVELLCVRIRSIWKPRKRDTNDSVWTEKKGTERLRVG
jgi:hypothetical protein